MRPSLLLRLVGIFAVGWVGATTSRAAEPISSLTWLSGCWELRRGERVTTEHWFAPAGGVMLGGSRTVKAGKLAEFEFLRIAEHEGKLAYIALPSGQKETVFQLVEQSEGSVLFANPQHDFPQRIRYQKLSADELLAQVEAGEGEATKVITFPYRRVACEPMLQQ